MKSNCLLNSDLGQFGLKPFLIFVDNLPNIGDTTQGFSPAPINETSPSDGQSLSLDAVQSKSITSHHHPRKDLWPNKEDAESASGQEMEGLDPSNSDRILKQKLKAEHFGVWLRVRQQTKTQGYTWISVWAGIPPRAIHGSTLLPSSHPVKSPW